MPTNILRNRGTKVTARSRGPRPEPVRRRVVIKAGRVVIRADLWSALPIHSTAETWGNSINFETPVETGRERSARASSEAGDIYFWSEEDRVIIAFGPTPISRGTEIRLPRPCNLWAKTKDDVALLKAITPGEKVSVTAA
jgi:hypothetical protein